MQRVKIPEAYRVFARAAHNQGWKITHTRNGHLAWTSPAGKTIFTPGTPSVRGTGIIRIRSKLRRGGLVV